MAADYIVGNPVLETEISEAGTGFSKVWRVPYKITDGPAKGTAAHVMIPAENYNAENVHAAIGSAVRTHHEVMSR